MIPDGYPYKVGNEWASPERFERIRQVLEQARTSHHLLTVKDMEDLQSDVVSIPAQQLQAQLRKAPNDDQDMYRKLILDWDCKLTRESAAAALDEVWISELRNALLEKRVPAAVRNPVRATILQHLMPDVLHTQPHPGRHHFFPL